MTLYVWETYLYAHEYGDRQSYQCEKHRNDKQHPATHPQAWLLFIWRQRWDGLMKNHTVENHKYELEIIMPKYLCVLHVNIRIFSQTDIWTFMWNYFKRPAT